MKFLSLIFVALFSQGYLLDYNTIMSRTSDNHGSGAYEVQQIIQWSADSAPLEILETWVVMSESKMKLTLEGLGRLKGRVSGEFIYDTQKKTFRDGTGKVINERLPATFDMVFFHFRSSKWMRERLVNLKLAPPQSLQSRPAMNPNDKNSYQPQSFVSLKRVGGTITYGIGLTESPSLFIEQDQFVVTKVIFPQGHSVLAEDYKETNGLYYPAKFSYSWGTNKLKVKTRKVTFLGKNPPAQLFQFSKDPKNLVLPEDGGLISSFYSAFR